MPNEIPSSSFFVSCGNVTIQLAASSAPGRSLDSFASVALFLITLRLLISVTLPPNTLHIRVLRAEHVVLLCARVRPCLTLDVWFCTLGSHSSARRMTLFGTKGSAGVLYFRFPVCWQSPAPATASLWLPDASVQLIRRCLLFIK